MNFPVASGGAAASMLHSGFLTGGQVGDKSQVQVVPVEFTGQGGEYFRIWIVNALLLVCTLGLYWPWARVRKLRYLYGNTVVDGSALDFQAEPKQMFKGYMLTYVLLGVYLVASDVSPLAGGVAAMALAAVWPWLIHGSMRFRLHHTTWRGLRFAFTGTAADAYKALAPGMVLGAMLLVAGSLGDPKSDQMQLSDQVWGALLLLLLLTLPWLFHRLKTYQHSHFAFGPLVMESQFTVGVLYAIWLKCIGIVIVSMGLFSGVMGLMSLTGWLSLSTGGFAAVGMMIMLCMLLVYPLVNAYFNAQMQNAIWGKTGCKVLRFKSRLSTRALMGLMIKNGLLTGITFGLYWPFAVIALTRLKVEAVKLHTLVPLSSLELHERHHISGAAGDAAGDLMGLDLGL